MTKVCISCINPDLKEIILQEVDDPGLRALPECADGSAIGFSFPDARDTGRRKRAPSAYNRFMGDCIRGGSADVPVPQRMKACSVQWKEKKAKG